MTNLEDLKNGWNFMAQILAVDMGMDYAYKDFMGNVAQNNAINLQNQHLMEINEAIELLAERINEHPNINLPVAQFKGFVAEEMHAGRFNIEALIKGSPHRAWTLQDNKYGSVDIDTNFGKQYSSKYSGNAKDAENMQAALNVYTREPKYQGQEQLIAGEQVEEAKAWAHRRALKELENRPDVANAHLYTEDHLTGKISDGEGVESKELSIKEATQIAKEAKKGKFDPEKHGIHKEAMLDDIRIDYVGKALEAGITAASIAALMQIVPELYKAIDYLIKNGEIDIDGLKSSGQRIISASGEAFLRGATAYGVEMAIQNGWFGEAIKNVNASLIGVAVTVIFSTIKDSILVASGKINPSEMGVHFIDTLVISSGYVASMKVAGIITQALFPELPGIAYVIGSLLGCSVSVVYSIGKRKLISFCVDTGFTCFGLVEQDYELPDRVLKELGVHTIQVPKTEISRTTINTTSISSEVNVSKYETIDISVLKRGIIGVNKVGYVLN